MKWRIILFQSGRKERFVEKFIKSLNESTIAKTMHTIDLLERHGPTLGMPHSKRIGANLYELRIRGREEIRIFYCFFKRKIYLLHAIKKKKQKVPKKEMLVALRRKSLLT